MNKNKQQHRTALNWGTGLAIAIVLFIGATLGVVAYLVSLDYHMVSENHYEKAVRYQEHIDRVEQTGTLASPVEIELLRRDYVIQIRFPSPLARQNLRGTVELYRPGDSSLDQEIDLMPGESGAQNIPAGNLARGKWLVKVSWTSGGKSYFTQKSIFL